MVAAVTWRCSGGVSSIESGAGARPRGPILSGFESGSCRARIAGEGAFRFSE